MHLVHLANAKSFKVGDNTSILDGALEAGLVLEHSCRTGRCGSCKALLLKGRVNELRADLALSDEERRAGWMLTCISRPTSDIELDVEDLALPASLKARTLPCRIDTLERAGPHIVVVRLRLPPGAEFRYLAGQYVEVIGKSGIRRSYSIANSPASSGELELHIREVDGGDMSQYWFGEARPNDLLRLHGPLGTFFLRDCAGLHLALLATGTGIAPIRAMLQDLTSRTPDQRPQSVSLHWGNRIASDLYWSPAELVGEPSGHFTFLPVLSRADGSWSGARGHVQDVLLQEAPSWADTAVYACGSPAMIDSARTALLTAGLPKRRFFSDAFVSSE